MSRYVERTRHDWWSTLWKLGVFVGVVLVAVLAVYPERGFVPTFLIIVAGLWMYVSLLGRGSGYRCASCGKVFRVRTAVNFFTPSGVAKNRDGTYYSVKNLTCPHCGRRTKARLVKRVDMRAAKGSGRLLR